MPNEAPTPFSTHGAISPEQVSQLIQGIRDLRRERDGAVRRGSIARAALDSAPQAVAIHNPSGRCVFVNAAFTRLTGLGTEALGSERGAAFRGAVELDRLTAEAIGSEAPVEHRTLATCCGIEGRELRLTAQRLPGERGPAAVVTTVTDETASEQERGLLFEILDALDFGVSVLDAETHRFEFINAAGLAMTGFPASELLGKVCHETICNPDRSQCPADKAGGCVSGCERTMLTISGEPLEVIKSVRTVELDGRSKLVESYMNLKDVKLAHRERDEAMQSLEHHAKELELSRRVALRMMEQANEAKLTADRARVQTEKTNTQLEEAVGRANELAAAAAQANAAKSEFLANMSHEIRTPLNGVLGMTSLLLETELSEEQAEFARAAAGSGRALLAVVNDVLEISKIESGQLEIDQNPFDLAELVDGLADIFSISAWEKKLDLSLELLPGAPTALIGDPARIRQILVNLLANAVKFTERGEVSLRVGAEHDEQAGPEPTIWFEVRDTGIGIPDDKLGTIFDSFSQVDGSSTRRFGGVGLGLAISKSLVQKMNGKITVASRVGEGSVFRFTVALQRRDENEAGDAKPTLEPGPAEVRGARGLVLDRCETWRGLLARRLEHWGVRVRAFEDAASARSALVDAAAAGDPYRFALADESLELGETPAPTRVIVLTHNPRPAAGESAMLSKPVKLASLAQRVAAATRADAKQDNDDRSTRASARKTSANPARVLLAEDNSTNQAVAIRMLTKLGHTVESVQNGDLAIQALRRERFDLVLMDVQMPVLDGLDTTRRIRRGDAGEQARSVPIIALTAYAAKSDRTRCLEAGMDDYLAKPMTFESIEALLDKWEPGGAARVEAEEREGGRDQRAA